MKLYGPDPEWRNEGDCNLFRWSRSRQQLMIDTAADEDNEIELNCAGPNHVNFRCLHTRTCACFFCTLKVAGWLLSVEKSVKEASLCCVQTDDPPTMQSNVLCD